VTGFDWVAGAWPPVTAAAAATMAKLNETRVFMVSLHQKSAAVGWAHSRPAPSRPIPAADI